MLEFFYFFEISIILEIRQVRDDNLRIDFGRADCHPPDDRPCATIHKKGHGLSTGGGRPYIYIYVYIYMCIYIYIYVFTHTHS